MFGLTRPGEKRKAQSNQTWFLIVRQHRKVYYSWFWPKINPVKYGRGVEMNLTEILNKQIANWSVMFIKLHNFHWYVTGDQFFTLHAKFEEFYTEAALHIDEIAERLLALGAKPVATMTGCLAIASIQEAKGNESTKDMVQAIINDFTQIISELRQGMEIAESVNDETTGDMLLAIHSGLEKHVWMLNSFLGK
jgi:starvation-inducible DNA-binding protein